MTWRSASPGDRQVAALWAVCALAALALRPFWIPLAGGVPPCLLHLWTGLPCPGCGSTRAVVRLLQGELRAGLAFNPLTACVAGGFVVGGIAAPAWLALGGRVPEIPAKPRPGWIAVLVIVVAANWAWLVASGV